MTIVESLATMLGLANILLLVRRSIWNYPFGIATVMLQGWLFLEARLYSDMLLQGFFVALNIYGWINWSRAAVVDGIPVRWMRPRAMLLALLGAIVATLLWGTVMHRHSDAAYPYWDGSVAMMSVLAQALLARRYIDNWLWWILIDIVAVPLYWTKGLPLIAGLYGVYLLMSVAGLVGWIRAYRT